MPDFRELRAEPLQLLFSDQAVDVGDGSGPTCREVNTREHLDVLAGQPEFQDELLRR